MASVSSLPVDDKDFLTEEMYVRVRKARDEGYGRGHAEGTRYWIRFVIDLYQSKGIDGVEEFIRRLTSNSHAED